jgi:mannose-6-phosphate isomerase
MAAPDGSTVTETSSRKLSRLDGALRCYAWGSRTELARLRGGPSPTAKPEAELWFGAHPTGPSHLQGANGVRPLDGVISEDPLAMLGAATVARFGPRLPYLLKVLAIDAPLSLQAHPSAAQAAAGFRVEEARGVPLDAAERTYRDSWPKPELLCALTEVDALAGFRDPRGTCALLDQLQVPELAWLHRDLAARGAAALLDGVERLLRWPAEERRPLVASLTGRAEALVGTGGVHAANAEWIVRLGAHYPADPGVAVATLMNLVRLRPGEAIHLPAGTLHAYLRGTAVEVMAASDNVVRGGLTAKHVDIEGLLHVLDPRAFPDPRVSAVPIAGGFAYPTSVEHFALERLVPGEVGVDLDRRGPEILLAVDGTATVVTSATAVDLASGEAVFVPAAEGSVRLLGPGPVFRATVGATGPR